MTIIARRGRRDPHVQDRNYILDCANSPRIRYDNRICVHKVSGAHSKTTSYPPSRCQMNVSRILWCSTSNSSRTLGSIRILRPGPSNQCCCLFCDDHLIAFSRLGRLPTIQAWHPAPGRWATNLGLFLVRYINSQRLQGLWQYIFASMVELSLLRVYCWVQIKICQLPFLVTLLRWA
jgi:hypothetical protein